MPSVSATDSSSRSAPDSRRSWIAAALIVFAIFAAYANSFHAPFVFDDQRAILDNPSIRSLWPLTGPLSPPPDAGGVIGRPLVNLSLAINYALGGTSVIGYHFFNVSLHALNTLIFFGIVRRTALRQFFAKKNSTQPALNTESLAGLMAFSIASLWSIHPLLTESVVCIVQRTEVIVGFFYLLTLYCFIRGCDEGRSAKWRGGSVLACLAGMASKEVMVTAPVAVFIYDRTFIAGSFAKAWRERKAFYGALASTWLLLIGLMLGSPDRAGVAGFGTGVSAWEYLLTQCRALGIYLKLSVWPHPLIVDYGTALVRSPTEVLLSGLLILSLIGGTVFTLRRRPTLGFLGACFFLILSPSSSVVPLASQTIAEHRMYLPLAPIIILLVSSAFRLIGKNAIWICLPLVLLAALTTHQRNEVYATELTLWSDTVAKYPQNARAHVNLGSALQSARRFDEAIVQYKESMRLDPLLGSAYTNLANIYLVTGKPDLAILPAESGVQIDPRDANARINLGLALAASGRLTEAVASYEEALRIEPQAADTEAYLASVLTRLSRPTDAISHYQKSLFLQPNQAAIWSDIAELFFEQNDHAASRHAAEQALKIQPDLATAHYTLGNLEVVAEHFPAAIASYRRALSSFPDYIAARNNLANALLVSGQLDEAIVNYREVLRQKPGDQSVIENLAHALELQKNKAR